MADRLFDRDLVLNIGGLRIASRLQDKTRQELGISEADVATILKVVFKITRTLKKEPNKAEVSIYNLKIDNRIKLQEKNIPTVIEAGYVDNTSQLFSGYLEFGENKKVGHDWVTTLQAGDGSKEFKSARINTSMKGPAKIGDVLKTISNAFGIDAGNIKDAISKGSLRGVLTEFTNGIVLSGKAEQNMDKVVKSMGYAWSIQDGKFLLLGPSDSIGEQAALLTPGTGLIGAPEPGEQGIVKARSLIQPALLPGYQVQIKSSDVDGFFRIERVDFIGDTQGTAWYADLECSPL